jgi:hypothetical protein
VSASTQRSRAFAVRAEFRRGRAGAPWVLAGVIVDGTFWPAQAGIERVRRRPPGHGLLGWADVPAPVIAPDREAAAEVALAVCAAVWPDRTRRPVPW